MASQIDLFKIKNVHFVGIGGIGMSALARHFLSEKKVVRGSDRELTNLTKTLAGEGIQICCPQTPDNIAPDTELVIYTEAVTKGSDGWAELEEAKRKKIPTVNYFEALGLAMNPYYLIAVAGTHGKTTTTAMLTDIFEAAEKDPTAVIGSLRAKTQSNYRGGKSKYAIVEACEYKRDFLYLRPEILVITNIELDHVDYYTSLADVQEAFKTLVSQVSETGVVVCNTKDPNVIPVVAGAVARVVDYTDFLDVQLALKQPGVHNKLNAAAAITAAIQEKINRNDASQALTQFAGTWRRYEYKGEINGVPVYDDYAHHPTAIAMTIAATKELYPDKKIVAVFKPHTFSRTAVLFSNFAKSFAGADQVLLLPIYGAREENVTGVSSRELAVKTLEYVPNSQYFDSHQALESHLRAHLIPGEVLIVMGAGDVTLVAESLTQKN
jgi:UDP-N-acetylmuramate--alanine ligase